jgi:hypothetical protein
VDGQDIVTRDGPNYGRYITDWNDKTDWFDHNLLLENLQHAQNVGWRQELHNDLMRIVGSWNWSYEHMDLACVGLTYATWLQSIWQWRPIVTLTGESGSGKTYLLEFLADLFLGSCPPLGSSSSAGIMQWIKHRALPLLMDEFDAAREQQKMFKAFRATSRGQKAVKGTASQDAKVYQLNHIPWLSGIFYSTTDQADLNRLIQLQLLKLCPTDKLLRPTANEAYHMGHKVLAACLTIAADAREMVESLNKMGEPSRYRESYSVPFATLGTMLGVDAPDANAMLEDYIDKFVKPEIDAQIAMSDQESALRDVLNATIRLPMEAPIQEPTVGMMLTDPEFSIFFNHLEPKGLALKTDRDGNVAYLAIDADQLQSPNGLLGNTRWRNTGGALKQLLRRLNGVLNSGSRTVRINGQVAYVITIPLTNLTNWMSKERITPLEESPDTLFT